MKFLFNLKHYLYTGLREVLVYHHSSLEFRAKVFAVIIAANRHPAECDYNIVFDAGMQIYKETDRANMLLLTTREYVQKVHKTNGLSIDDLIDDIRTELRQIPRYVHKINPEMLLPLSECTVDEDTSTYQIRIIEFLERIKSEYS
ncbi:hypothetical protein ACFLR3_02195 [Campylobacterota bacterium]